MKKLLLNLIFIFFSILIFGQNENPFSQFGYVVPVMQTKDYNIIESSYFIIPNPDTVSKINFLIIDFKNRNLSFYYKNGNIITQDTISPSLMARWLSPYPLNQFNSPYIGLGNDPINGIDSDGKLVIFANGYMPFQGR